MRQRTDVPSLVARQQATADHKAALPGSSQTPPASACRQLNLAENSRRCARLLRPPEKPEKSLYHILPAGMPDRPCRQLMDEAGPWEAHWRCDRPQSLPVTSCVARGAKRSARARAELDL